MGIVVALCVIIGLLVLWGAGEGDPGAMLLLIWIVSLVVSCFVIRKRGKFAHTLYRPWVNKFCNKLPLLRLIFGFPRFWLTVCTIVMITRVINAAIASAYVGMVSATVLEWGLVLLGITIIGAIYCAVFDMALIKMVIRYKKTEYYAKTGYTRGQILNDKSLWGEFLAFAYCDRVKGHKRLLFNAIVPKHGNDHDFAEIDMICICEGGVHVIEAKNRGGTLRGNTLEPEWTQIIGNQENEVYNPVLQNQNHIIALARYLQESIPLGTNHSVWTSDPLRPEFFNHIFLADPDCQLDMSGQIPYGSAISWNSQLTESIEACGDAVIMRRLLTDESIDLLADILEETTRFTPQERAELIRSRTNWRETAPKERTFYFVQLDMNSCKSVDLYRFNSSGIALFREGFWYPPEVNGIGSWKDRLPYCTKDYSDITSFSKAKEVADELQRMLDDPYYSDTISKHIKEKTLGAYLKNNLPHPGICYLEGGAHLESDTEEIVHPGSSSAEPSEVNQLPEFKPDEKDQAFCPADEKAAAETGKLPKVFSIEKFPNGKEVSPVSGLTPGQEKYDMLLKLAEKSNPEAIKAIGDCWLNGNLGEEGKWDNAVTNYRFAASKGVASAQNNLGVVLLLMKRENAEEALLAFTLAAEQGNRNAQYNLGAVYDEGILVDRDFWKARYWMERAGEQNQIYACQWLASMYETGDEVPADPERAAYWKQRATSE